MTQQRRALRVATLVWLFACLTVGTAWGQSTEALKGGVVKIVTRSASVKTGAGFVVRREADRVFIVTAAHVVEDGDSVQVYFYPDGRPLPAQVRNIELNNDQGMALLEVVGPLADTVQALTLRTEQELSGGEPVLAIGHQPGAGGDWSVLSGVVSNRSGRTLRLQVPVMQQASGGPVIFNGGVVGLVTQKEANQGFGVALTAAEIKSYVQGFRFAAGPAPATATAAPRVATASPPAAPVPVPAVATAVAIPGGNPTIKVGIVHSLSGGMAATEAALKDTALMAIDEINARGGLLGRRIEPVVVDPASNWPLFAEKAKQLLDRDKVAVIFGGFTSVSRKSMLPVLESLNGLLFFPAQHEGEELSKNIFYTGSVPNQVAVPAVEYLMSRDGGGAKRFMLLGTDYLYPRVTNKILRSFLRSKGMLDEDIIEEYVPFGHANYQTIVAKIKKFSAEGKKTAVVSTLNGDSNLPFYMELGNQGLKAPDLPVVAFSVGEAELRGIDSKPLQGHLAAANYFMSIRNPTNDGFINRWSAYAKVKRIAGHQDRPLINDAMEATYIGVNLWAQAVTSAGSTDTDKVIAAMAGRTFVAPSGVSVKMDERNHHLQRSAFVGEIRNDGQLNIVWKSASPVRANAWSPFIAENKGKKDEP